MKTSGKFATAALGMAVFLLAGCEGIFQVADEESIASDLGKISRQLDDLEQRATMQTGGVAQIPVDEDPLASVVESSPVPSDSIVGKKIDELSQNIGSLGGQVDAVRKNLDSLDADNQSNANAYYALVGHMTARLQRGTTPGNPTLKNQWVEAQNRLETIAGTLPVLVRLSSEVSSQAAFGQYLLSDVQATYGLTGATESDHLRLDELDAELQTRLNNIDRLVTRISEAINRQTIYINNERQNLTTLSLAIRNGELYGANVSTQAYLQTEKRVHDQMRAAMITADDKPLVVVRFDKPNIKYQQVLYNAISQAVARKPDVIFLLEMVTPKRGTGMRVVSNNAAAQRRSQEVLRTMMDMGVPRSRIQLVSSVDEDISFNEARIYVQ